MLTGKSMTISYMGKEILYHNQSCRAWTHPYVYMGQGNETLSTSGCGIFALCHAVEYMNGIRLDPDEMADFAMKHGGRGDDGTDRPALLDALMATGEAQKMGFRYMGDGLRNDLDELFSHIYLKRGVAFCNLRVGHIVALVDARIVDGEKQFLVIDSVAESFHNTVRDHVCEVIAQSETKREWLNDKGLFVGTSRQFAMFYVQASLPRDFNLLHKLA